MGTIEKRLLKNGDARYDARIHRRNAIGTKGGWQSKTFKNEKEARLWVNKTESLIDGGKSISKRADKLTFAQVAADYMAQAKPTPKQEAKARAAAIEAKAPYLRGISDDERRTIAMLVDHWGEFRISGITQERVEGWMERFAQIEIKEPKNKKKAHPYFKGGLDKDGKKRTYAASTIRRHYFVFKKIVQWAAMTHGFPLNPKTFSDIAAPDAWKGKRERRFQPGEEAKLLAAIDKGYAHKQAWRAIVHFALETTARMQEIVLAERKEFDRAGRLWKIPKEHVKTGKARTVPLTTTALECLALMDGMQKPEEFRVFHQWKTSATLSKAWARLSLRAGMRDFTFHDLRHESTSRLFESTDLKDVEIMKITGHSSHEILSGYVGLRDKSVAERMDAMRKANPASPASPA